MRTATLIFVGCILMLSGGLVDLTAAPKLYIMYPTVGEIVISVDPDLHQKFGLAYPVTYRISIPAGSTGLSAYTETPQCGDLDTAYRKELL